jgi:hypothetical protein
MPVGTRLGVLKSHSGADFSMIFSGENFGENFGENSAENFPPKNVGKKWNFPRKKSFEKSFFQEIPRNFPRKKMYEKLAPGLCHLFDAPCR